MSVGHLFTHWFLGLTLFVFSSLALSHVLVRNDYSHALADSHILYYQHAYDDISLTPYLAYLSYLLAYLGRYFGIIFLRVLLLKCLASVQSQAATLHQCLFMNPASIRAPPECR